jgi:hypothetical protein
MGLERFGLSSRLGKWWMRRRIGVVYRSWKGGGIELERC